MKFSKANAKIRELAHVPAICKFLSGNRKVYSFDILSGHTCPYAKDCKSMVVEQSDGKLKIVDSPTTDFRCFSASQEAFFTKVYQLRKANTEIVKLAAVDYVQAAVALNGLIPKNTGVIRIHVGGDFKTQAYFDTWRYLAYIRPDILFYAYTKSLPFWVARLGQIPDNFILTASYGGYKDNLIPMYNLRSVKVVESKKQARQLHLPIDHTDSHAADPAKKNKNFALLIHGIQPAGSRWGKAVRELKGEGSYKR